MTHRVVYTDTFRDDIAKGLRKNNLCNDYQSKQRLSRRFFCLPLPKSCTGYFWTGPKHVAYLRQQHVSDNVIERWYDRLFIQLDALSTWPNRYSIDERTSAGVGEKTRKFVYRPYVITYQVDENQRSVLLLRMIHGARRKSQ